MSRWTDVTVPFKSPTNKGAKKRLKTLKRQEAQHRNDATWLTRTRAYRRSLDATQRNAYLIGQHLTYCPDPICSHL